VSGKRALVIALVIVVALVVIRGIMIIGSPSEERTRRIDSRRVSDLQRISQAITVYYTRHQRLPSSLGELGAEPGMTIATADSENARPYEFRGIDAERYELCASFAREMPRGAAADFWSHGAGRQCFTVKVKE
jgi:hypothetical protein